MADGHEITLEEAKVLTAAYRSSATYEANGRIAIAFNKEAIDRLMNKDDVVGLRCYFAHGTDGLLTLVLVAHDAEGNDLTRELAESGNPCPVFCSSENDLNS